MTASDARRPFRLVVLVGLLLVTFAGPAAADPAGPTNYDSVVTAVEPDDAPFEVEVLGGDAFLVLHAEPDVRVEVPGYEDEPYVRFEADGTVLVNERSPARWLNDARYGELEVDLPTIADAQAEPVFVVVADDGTYAWHDHRIHFMSPTLPAQVDPGAGTPQPVMDWTVPLVVDGQPMAVEGTLRWIPGPSPLVPGLLVVAALAAAAAVVVGSPRVAPALAGAGALLALGVALTKTIGLPAGADAEPMLLVLPGLTLVLLGVGQLLDRRSAGSDPRAALIAAAAGIPLLVWAVLQLGALTRPIVPGPLPVGAVRLAVAVTAAAGLASLGTLARGVLAATSLDPSVDAAR
ncbi:hypothetical protein [Egicoccus halophilus]|uniref:Uncharacterized protein n=1 Tax=Egicoccus halophilus TaxID=1670830 RepID=A0A8J3ABB6_9ACTN|nr:hypothetical protein [Egicoccus halophilus]GGI02927.1 hypothetical protein GCM10011354_02020 [Egicoccus halophilus]